MTTPTVTTELVGPFVIDASHTRIGFVARHALVTKVRGSFTSFEGIAFLDEANPSQSKAEVRIAAASIDTGNADRDAHLRSADFFDVEAHPEITFVSTSAEKVGDAYRLTGDLTIKGISKPVTIDFEHGGVVVDPWGSVRAGFEGSVDVHRKEWGLTWNAALEAGGVLVSEKVKLEFDVAAVKQA